MMNTTNEFPETHDVFSSFGEVDLIKNSQKRAMNKQNIHSPFPQEIFLPYSHLIFTEKTSLEDIKNLKQKDSQVRELKDVDIKKNNLDLLEIYNNGIVFDRTAREQELGIMMKKYDQKKDRENRIVRNIKNKADKDGWITVVPKSKTIDLSSIKFGEGKEREVERELTYWQRKRLKKRKRDKQKKLEDEKKYSIYEFQRIEKKKQKLVSLREQFEKERQKIKKMKEKRLFNLIE